MIRKKPTIEDIAKIAVASLTAVSMALNDQPCIGARDPREGSSYCRGIKLCTQFPCERLSLKRMYNVGLGVSRKDDFVPYRFLTLERVGEDLTNPSD
jgi:hypothetical protein